MAKIPVNMNSTEFLLNQGECDETFNRTYLGMSGIAGDCDRKIWLNWRWASKKIVSKRTKRIFERGDIEEARVIRDLKSIGIRCFRKDSDGNEIEITGDIGEEQEEFVGFGGHVKGHSDGRCIGVIEAPKTEHNLEIKTAKDSSFKKFKRDGCKETSETYYGQSQRYMLETGNKRTLFVVVNKDTEEIYVERLHFDKDFAEMLVAKEQALVMSEEPPALEYKRDFYKCKMCHHRDLCHNDSPPLKTCRSCAYCDLTDGGVWECSLNDKKLSKDEQIKGCNSYKRLF